MRQIEQQHYDVIVIGGGQAGLAISYLLKQEKINHIVVERNQIANSWVHQRWDSFTLNTPNWMNLLPGMVLAPNEDREAFKTNAQYIDTLVGYAKEHDLPVIEQCEVTAVHKGKDCYSVMVRYQETMKTLSANQVVVASGQMSDWKNPLFAYPIPSTITQINAAEYKNPTQVKGNVLIVGSGQSGVQLAEELAKADYMDKGQLYLATSEVGRSPRRYRGKDMMEWLSLMGVMDMRMDELEDVNISRQTQPQVSGVGTYGHTVSLQSLHKMGVTPVGKLLTSTEKGFTFSDEVKQHIAFADQGSETLKSKVDSYLKLTNQDDLFPQDEIDEADCPDVNFSAASSCTALSFSAIDTLIWAMGYQASFSYLHIPHVLNERDSPYISMEYRHNQGCTIWGFLG